MLQGKVTAIGGLDLKIIGGIQSGVDTFVYPSQNDKEYNDFMDKYKDNTILKGITFCPVSNINEGFKTSILSILYHIIFYKIIY